MRTVLMVVCVALLAVGLATAVKPNGNSAANGLTKGPVMHLELYEKDPATWEPVDDGAWGRLTLRPDGNWVFNAHGLEPGAAYALVVYDTVAGDDDLAEWPGEGPLLGSAVADDEGNLHLMGDVADCLDEAKIWLVLDADQDDGVMTAWHPSAYLFEYARLDTCE